MNDILVVDDKAENLYLLNALLRGNGFSVTEATNGARALELARAGRFALVISDLLMPVMDGYTLLRHWKTDPDLQHIPFVVYTATYTSPNDEKLALDMGADAFLLKPTEPEEFMRRVREVLGCKAKGAAGPAQPREGELTVLREYSEVLVAKLEKRSVELEARVAELDRAERHIRRLNRLYAALSETNQAIVHTASRDELLDRLCRIAVERGGLTAAWVGIIDERTRELRPQSRCGTEPAWIVRLAPLAMDANARTPAEIALHDGRIYLCNDLLADPRLSAIHDEIRRHGFASAAALPLRINDTNTGCLELLSVEADFFDDAMIDLVAEMASDVSFALQNFVKEGARRHAEDASRLMSRAVEASANGIMIVDARHPKLPLIYVNPAFERITGYAAAEAIGRYPRFLMGAEPHQFGSEEVAAAIREQRNCEVVLRNYRKDGSLFWNELSIAPVPDAKGAVTHFVGIINDISERKIYEEQLERQVNQDVLTGLASRNLLRDRTGQAIAFAAQRKRTTALLFIDLDHFKRINESLGHGSGDMLLRAVAGRIAACMQGRDTLARLGGDEFVAILADLAGVGDIPLIAGKILRALDAPFAVGDREIDISASMGIAVYPSDGDDYDALLRNADAAMYRAKTAGRNTFRFYTADMNAEALRKLELEARLRRSLGREELVLHYQPLIEAASGRITDAEALLRWRTDNGVLMAPGEFIPLAEETGLIVPIGEWVLQEACRQARQWQQAGHALRVAVNLSARQFSDPRLLGIVRHALDESKLPAELLKLEITESAVMENAGKTAAILAELQALGVGLSIDDFGTGYSSLAYLKRFPIDQLKIDRSFVHDLAEQPESASIVRGIIDLARSLHLQTVAEGVETPEQRDFLRNAGCHLLQGYLFSRPLAPEAFAAMLAPAREAR